MDSRLERMRMTYHDEKHCHSLHGILASADCIFNIFTMQSAECSSSTTGFGTLNQCMGFLEFKHVIYIENFEFVFSKSICYRVSSIVKYGWRQCQLPVARLVHVCVCHEILTVKQIKINV